MHQPDRVRIFAEWCDGPRAGVVDFQGQPHLYLSDFADVDNVGAEEILMLMSLVPAESDQLALDLLAAGGVWSHCGNVVYSGDDGTIYAPSDNTDLARWQRAWDNFYTVWNVFKTRMVSSAESCLLARGWDFQVSRLVPTATAEADCDDRLPLVAVWPAELPQVGRNVIDDALRRWELMQSPPEDVGQHECVGRELPF